MDRSCHAHGRGLITPIDLTHPLVGELLARASFPEAGTEVVCAVSGGPDSLALLVLAVGAGCRATAIHVDHALREGSAGEADVVAEVASALGAAFRSERVEVGDGPNLEARARAARARVLPAGSLTGHTADDRAETVLLHLIRGAGPAGAIGMARSGTRPLLDLRRGDTVALCSAMGLDPVHDPSNDDPRFRRNRVRHELIPLLASIGERDPVPVLVRQADLFADVDDALALAAAEIDATVVAQLVAAPVAVAGAAVRSWLIRSGVGMGYAVDGATVARVLDVAHGRGVATEVAGGWRVARSKGRLSVRAPRSWQDAAHD